MFERFTEGARRVVVLAQEEARLLNHNYIGTEHLLLGLVHEGDGIGARALEALGISLDTVRGRVEEIIGQGVTAPSGQIPFTPRAKKVLELSLREALQFGHNYIGTEHILLGLIREGEGVAARVLTESGADAAGVRQAVIRLLAVHAERPGAGEETAGRAPFSFGAGYTRGRRAGTPRLVRVVPIGREVDAGDGHQLVLLSLEIWSDWLDLRLAVAASRAAGAQEPSPQDLSAGYQAWTLSDDLGTDYRPLGTSSGGGELFFVCQASFAPSPPKEAGTLTLTLPAAGERDEIQVVVELK